MMRTQMRKCLIISFDFSKEKDGYPPLSYQIASILAKFKGSNFIENETLCYNMREYEKMLPSEVEYQIIKRFKKDKTKDEINEYSFIAIAVYAWSENIVNKFIQIIHDYNFAGKVILGGYEITALSDEQLYKTYPNADYYVKGYAEVSLEKIFKNEAKNNILYENITDNDLVSVYLSDTLPLTTKNIYWESKRGCPYRCDFCEWGNAGNRKIIRLNKTRIDNEIELFKLNEINKINVIDGSFLLNKDDIVTLEKLVEIKDCKIILQVNFNNLKNELGDKFLSICENNKDKILLEFGLQTIHKKEMKVLNRDNDIKHIKSVMKALNRLNIQYEISIIFGIPGQTMDSFQSTIEFIEKNGCKNYKGFPLRLPQNSKMKNNADKLKIKEEYSSFDSFPIKIVKESYSFTHLDWEMMYSIAKKIDTENGTQAPIPRAFIPIMLEFAENYNILNMKNGLLIDKISIKKLSDHIFERLCKNDISNIILLGTGADKFSKAINKILSIKPLRELCIKDRNFALSITQKIIDFITKTQQHILKNEPQFLPSESLSQKKLEWELDIIDTECKIFCEELYRQIEQKTL